LDATAPHSGKHALKLSISPEELRNNASAACGVSARHFVFSTSPKFPAAGVWVKSEGLPPRPKPASPPPVRYKEAGQFVQTLQLRCPAGSKELGLVEQDLQNGRGGILYRSELNPHRRSRLHPARRPVFSGAADGAHRPAPSEHGRYRVEQKAFARDYATERWICVDHRNGRLASGAYRSGRRHTLEIEKTRGRTRHATGVPLAHLSSPVTVLITKPYC